MEPRDPSVVELYLGKKLQEQLTECKKVRILIGGPDNSAYLSVGCRNADEWPIVADMLQTILPGGVFVLAVYLPPSETVADVDFSRGRFALLELNDPESPICLISHHKVGHLKALQHNLRLFRLKEVDNVVYVPCELFLRGRTYIDLAIHPADLQGCLTRFTNNLEESILAIEPMPDQADGTEVERDSQHFTLIMPTRSPAELKESEWQSGNALHTIKLVGWIYTCAISAQWICDDVEKSVRCRLSAVENQLSNSKVSDLKVPRRHTIQFGSMELSDYRISHETNMTTVNRFADEFDIIGLEPTDVLDTVEGRMFNRCAKRSVWNISRIMEYPRRHVKYAAMLVILFTVLLTMTYFWYPKLFTLGGVNFMAPTLKPSTPELSRSASSSSSSSSSAAPCSPPLPASSSSSSSPSLASSSPCSQSGEEAFPAQPTIPMGREL